MHYLIKELIEAYIDEIDDNNFTFVYDRLNEYVSNDLLVPILTQEFKHAGIDPLNYVDVIPKYYLYNTQITQTLNIRPGIKAIGDHAFGSNDKLGLLRIPASCKRIGAWSFAHCYNLKKIIIDSPEMELNYLAFYACTEIYEITYAGTIEQWEKFFGNINELNAPDTLIHCINGDFKV